MINNMRPGSIIYDLAAIQGGNTAFTEVDKIIDKHKSSWGNDQYAVIGAIEQIFEGMFAKVGR